MPKKYLILIFGFVILLALGGGVWYVKRATEAQQGKEGGSAGTETPSNVIREVDSTKGFYRILLKYMQNDNEPERLFCAGLDGSCGKRPVLSIRKLSLRSFESAKDDFIKKSGWMDAKFTFLITCLDCQGSTKWVIDSCFKSGKMKIPDYVLSIDYCFFSGDAPDSLSDSVLIEGPTSNDIYEAVVKVGVSR